MNIKLILVSLAGLVIGVVLGHDYLVIAQDSENEITNNQILVEGGTTPMVLTGPSYGVSPVLFTDDFSTNKGWSDASPSADHSFSLTNGELRMVVTGENRNIRMVTPVVETDLGVDFSIEVEGNKETGNGVLYGIMFNFENEDGYHYRFGVEPDSRYYQLRVFDGDNRVWVDLVEGQSDSIKSGNQKNKLKLVRSGKLIRGFVNGQLVAEVSDARYLTGKIGLATRAGTGTGAVPAAARFDNFIVKHGRADLDADGDVDVFDFGLVRRWFGL